MPVISTSVRGGIVAMLAKRTAGLDAAGDSTAASTSNGTAESDILVTRSGYIVVAG